MHALLLATTLVLAADPAGLDAFVKPLCNVQRKPDVSNAELKGLAEKRATCLKDVMNKQLDKFLVPLKKKDSASFRAWMKLQADYNKWVKDACVVAEENEWVDFSTREVMSGTGSGFTTLACWDAAYSERAFFARGLTDGKLGEFWDLVRARQASGEKGRKELEGKLAEGRKSVPATDGFEVMPEKEFKILLGQVEGVLANTAALAKAQCAALKDAPDGCEKLLANYLLSVPNYAGRE